MTELSRPSGGIVKHQHESNKLCLSCRRQCKQPAATIIASCPRYYPGTKIKRESWRQMELNLPLGS